MIQVLAVDEQFLEWGAGLGFPVFGVRIKEYSTFISGCLLGIR